MSRDSAYPELTLSNSPYADECQWRGQVNLAELHSDNAGLRVGAGRASR
jgi:hypothetical protein